MPSAADIDHNLSLIHARIEQAAGRAGRKASEITLVAVSKTFGPDAVRAAVRAGQTAFGENRVQELATKAGALAGEPIEWHLIGHLQSNKVRKAVGVATWIQSIDSLDLLERVDAAARELGVRRKVLLQVDLAQEATKFGAQPRELPALVSAALEAKALELGGLMMIPPFAETPEDSRPWFRQLREIRDRLIDDGVPAERLGHLSMGMSGDFEVAVEEGATIVRVGTAIFGGRVSV